MALFCLTLTFLKESEEVIQSPNTLIDLVLFCLTIFKGGMTIIQIFYGTLVDFKSDFDKVQKKTKYMSNIP